MKTLLTLAALFLSVSAGAETLEIKCKGGPQSLSSFSTSIDVPTQRVTPFESALGEPSFLGLDDLLQVDHVGKGGKGDVKIWSGKLTVDFGRSLTNIITFQVGRCETKNEGRGGAQVRKMANTPIPGEPESLLCTCKLKK